MPLFKFDVLHKYAERMGLDYKELVRVVESAVMPDYGNCDYWCPACYAAIEKPEHKVVPDGVSLPAVPQGWKLVPVEPTEAMVREIEHTTRLGGIWTAESVYRAMVEAAPSYGVASVDGGQR